MPMKIRISADSTGDLTRELLEQYDVKIEIGRAHV